MESGAIRSLGCGDDTGRLLRYSAGGTPELGGSGGSCGFGPTDRVRDRVGLCARLGPRDGRLLGLDVADYGVRGRHLAAVWAGVGLTIGVTSSAEPEPTSVRGRPRPPRSARCSLRWAACCLWAAFSVLTGSVAAVAVERDVPSGLRTAALLVALGLILGRWVAGDWVSVESTLRDYLRQGLAPAAALVGIAAIIEFVARPTVRRPVTSIARSGFGASRARSRVRRGMAVASGARVMIGRGAMVARAR